VVAEVGIREIVRPAVENPGQGSRLSATRWQVSLQYEHQDDVSLRSKISHVLGDDGPALRSIR
jgi:hypothetical protein